MIFVLGFFMSLGKAAVYKHIPVYYPENVGAVGGLVGMIGGLGGFILPLLFGVLNDLTGLWSSCFMALFVIVAAVARPGCTSPSSAWRAAPGSACTLSIGTQFMTEKLVVIGNGMARCRAVEELLERDPDRYDVTIFGAEPRVNYNRIMLSPVLAGEKSFDEIVIHDDAWYAENGIDRPARRAGDAIDRERSASISQGRRDALRQAADRHRLGALHHPGAGQGPAGRGHLPRPRRRRARCSRPRPSRGARRW